MLKSTYATAEESASFMKPDTRTNAEKILYELQKEQTNGFEMGHDVDNGAIALKVIERNLELLEALHVVLRDYMAVHGVGDLEMQPALFQARAAMAKVTGGAA